MKSLTIKPLPESLGPYIQELYVRGENFSSWKTRLLLLALVFLSSAPLVDTWLKPITSSLLEDDTAYILYAMALSAVALQLFGWILGRLSISSYRLAHRTSELVMIAKLHAEEPSHAEAEALKHRLAQVKIPSQAPKKRREEEVPRVPDGENVEIDESTTQHAEADDDNCMPSGLKGQSALLYLIQQNAFFNHYLYTRLMHQRAWLYSSAVVIALLVVLFLWPYSAVGVLYPSAQILLVVISFPLLWEMFDSWLDLRWAANEMGLIDQELECTKGCMEPNTLIRVFSRYSAARGAFPKIPNKLYHAQRTFLNKRWCDRVALIEERSQRVSEGAGRIDASNAE